MDSVNAQERSARRAAVDAARRRRPLETPRVVHDVIARRIASRYRLRSHRAYVRGKLRWDPLFPAVAPLFAESSLDLLDIGCGLGLLGQYLRESGFRGRYFGLDLDAAKIGEARIAAESHDLDLRFAAETADTLPDVRGNVALLDVLHYMPEDTQRRVLAGSAERVAPGGAIVIRNVLRDGSWRFQATVAEEMFSRAFGWMRSPVGHFPSREDVTGPLEAAGLDVRVEPLWGRTPFNSYLIVARRG